MEETFIAGINDKGQRLDKFLSSKCASLSRSYGKELIKKGFVIKNGQILDNPAYKIKEGDQFTFTLPKSVEAKPIPQKIPLKIIYEDSDLIVLDKPVGLVVHPAPGHSDQTLVNALLAYCGTSLSGINGIRRPGIVHRLDKDTSGLMVIAKHDQAHQYLSAQFSFKRELSRVYWAFVWGCPSPSSSVIKTAIGRSPFDRQKMAVKQIGKEAITHYKVLKTFQKGDLKTAISLVECRLETGRTHQIRIHMTYIGHPLVGDPLYGTIPKGVCHIWPLEVLSFPRQALHAKELAFIHPTTKEKVAFTSDLPEDLQNLYQTLCEKSSL